MEQATTARHPVEVRALTRADYPTIAGWWVSAGQRPPVPEALPESSSFLLTFDGEPVLAVTVYLTNCKEVAYLENFIGSPTFSKVTRRKLAQSLMSYCEAFARSLGFRRLLCLSPNAALERRYSELGLSPTIRGVTAHAKELV